MCLVEVVYLPNLSTRGSIHQLCISSRKNMLEICLVVKCPMGKYPSGKFPGIKNMNHLSLNRKGSA